MNLPKNLPAVSITPAVADDDGSLSGLMATLPVAGFEARLLFSTHCCRSFTFSLRHPFFLRSQSQLAVPSPDRFLSPD